MKTPVLKLTLWLLILASWCLLFFGVNRGQYVAPPNSTVPMPVDDEKETIPQSEADALLAIFNTLDGAHWQKSNMLEDPNGYFRQFYPWPIYTEPPCHWYGIDCWQGHVVRLDLSGVIVNGTFPIEIAHLTELEQLGLRYTPEGRCSLPNQFSQLKKMQTLDAVYSCLNVGKLSPEIKAMDIAILTLMPGRDIVCLGKGCNTYWSKVLQW